MKRITIICSGLKDPVSEVTALLSDNAINISDLNFTPCDGESLMSLVISDNDRAAAVLTEAGYQTVSEDVVLIIGEDRPGVLAELSRSLSDEGVQIRSLTIAASSEDGPVVAIATNDNDKVRELFAEKLVN